MDAVCLTLIVSGAVFWPVVCMIDGNLVNLLLGCKVLVTTTLLQEQLFWVLNSLALFQPEIVPKIWVPMGRRSLKNSSRRGPYDVNAESIVWSAA